MLVKLIKEDVGLCSCDFWMTPNKFKDAEFTEKCVHALFRTDHVCDFWSSIKHLKHSSDLVFFLKSGVQYEPKVNAKELMLYFFAVLFKLSFSTDLRP